jgi:hypothetical protein
MHQVHQAFLGQMKHVRRLDIFHAIFLNYNSFQTQDFLDHARFEADDLGIIFDINGLELVL